MFNLIFFKTIKIISLKRCKVAKICADKRVQNVGFNTTNLCKVYQPENYTLVVISQRYLDKSKLEATNIIIFGFLYMYTSIIYLVHLQDIISSSTGKIQFTRLNVIVYITDIKANFVDFNHSVSDSDSTF